MVVLGQITVVISDIGGVHLLIVRLQYPLLLLLQSPPKIKMEQQHFLLNPLQALVTVLMTQPLTIAYHDEYMERLV